MDSLTIIYSKQFWGKEGAKDPKKKKKIKQGLKHESIKQHK